MHALISHGLCRSRTLLSVPVTVPSSRPFKLHAHLLKMESNNNDKREEETSKNTTIQPSGKLQELLQDPLDGWNKCWQHGLTPWDLGQPTPVVLHLVESGSLPNGKALVPGCGSGYDVVALASPERYVVGLDIAETAMAYAKELFSSAPNSDNFTFVAADFFTWRTTELFDLIFDYTFFCAIEPNMRFAWAKRMQELLKIEGELITLMFPVSDHVGGPPYKVSVADYEEVLHPCGFKAITIQDNEYVITPRKGMEILGRWRKVPKHSSL